MGIEAMGSGMAPGGKAPGCGGNASAPGRGAVAPASKPQG